MRKVIAVLPAVLALLTPACNSDGTSGCTAVSPSFAAGSPVTVIITVEKGAIGVQDLGGQLWAYRDLPPAWGPVTGTIEGVATISSGTMKVDAGEDHVLVLHAIGCY